MIAETAAGGFDEETVQSLRDTASSAPSEASARMSLMIFAPSASAARMTSALHVSTDRGTPQSRSACSTGTSREISSGAETVSAPGRDDSAPRSTQASPTLRPNSSPPTRERASISRGATPRFASW